MAELARIPAVTVYHIPTPTSEPIKLAEGDLLLTSLPPDGLNPTERLTLSVAHVSFPITTLTPIGKTDSINQHASYVFLPGLPTPAGGSVTSGELPTQAAFGKIKLVMKDSTSPAGYEAAEEFARLFEAALREKKVYKEAGYYDIEDEEKRLGQPASYGTVLGTTLSSYGRFFAGKIQELTDGHVASNANPTHPAPPSEGLKNITKTLAEGSTVAAGYINIAAEAVTKVVHDGAMYAAAGAKELVKEVRGEDAGPANETVQSAKRGVEDAWEEVKIGASGAAEGGRAIGQSLHENTHKAIVHDFGEEADGVARNIGTVNTNIASAGYDATRVGMTNVHVANAAVGAGTGIVKEQV